MNGCQNFMDSGTVFLKSKHLNMPAGDEDDEEGAVARPGGGN